MNLGDARFDDLDVETARRFTQKVAELTQEQLDALLAHLEARRVLHANYRTNVNDARALLTAVLTIAAAVAG